jgi:hypothetical protein
MKERMEEEEENGGGSPSKSKQNFQNHAEGER